MEREVDVSPDRVTSRLRPHLEDTLFCVTRFAATSNPPCVQR